MEGFHRPGEQAESQKFIPVIKIGDKTLRCTYFPYLHFQNTKANFDIDLYPQLALRNVSIVAHTWLRASFIIIVDKRRPLQLFFSSSLWNTIIAERNIKAFSKTTPAQVTRCTFFAATWLCCHVALPLHQHDEVVHIRFPTEGAKFHIISRWEVLANQLCCIKITPEIRKKRICKFD